MKVAIVGGGVIGLTTAWRLRRELQNASVTVLAAEFDNTVSHVAAGIFRVGSSYSGPTEEITREWIADSYEFYDNIRKSTEASYAGVTSISGYMFANSSPDVVKNHWIERLVPIYRKASDEEFELVGGTWKYGSFYTTLLTQCNFYLPWMRQKLRDSGCTLVQQKLESFTELIPEYDIIINCTGLGARSLCNDRKLVPIRGQVIKVQAPWLKTFFYGELDTYVIPGFNGNVTLGGSRYFDSENLNICPYESAAIRYRCETLVPALKKAKILGEEVGLRPHKDNVRIEVERVKNGHTKAILVHNYGHGGYGVCTAPGTAKHAVKLAMESHACTTAKL